MNAFIYLCVRENDIDFPFSSMRQRIKKFSSVFLNRWFSTADHNFRHFSDRSTLIVIARRQLPSPIVRFLC
jgi:hypothetical protein